MNAKEIFHLMTNALEDDRADFLFSVCGGDADLCSRLEERLRAQAGSSGTEAYIPHQEHGEPTAVANQQLGMEIAGRYRLVEVIGEGGMGSVYRAEQTEPVKRQVAVKLIKGGVDSRSVQARFDAERQALALMDHPNIARVFDGGATATGQPFFVMELVKGVPLTHYCDLHRLSVPERLQLFVSVCQAVQHAHQKGIIHRDLKPGNVLVTEVDGRPTPKVIDFGVAKATEIKLTDQSYVDVGLIVGTPSYMSPEQADPTSMDIDTRSDVYALGVMLYELLAGAPPIDAKQFQRGAILEMLRMVREVEPPRPSTRLSTADALPSIAANRSIEPAKLGRLLKGELDWVVMKAMEKDRTRRYETANGLARDVQRYLADEPVEARPPSAGYRLRKFMRRNRVLVSAVMSVAAALLIGIVAFAWQAKIARDQRDRAVLAESETKKRADELQKVAAYQVKMLEKIDPIDAGIELMADLRKRHQAMLVKTKVPENEQSTRSDTFVRELQAINATDAAVAMLDRTVLAPAVITIDSQFSDQPIVDATLRTTLAGIYYILGQREQALSLYRRAYELRRDVLGDHHVDTLLVLGGVGKVLGEQQKLVDAETTIRAVVEGLQRIKGADCKETLDARSLLATQMTLQGRYADCEVIIRDLIERRTRLFGTEHEETLDAKRDLGKCLTSRGQYADAVTILREVADIQRREDRSSIAVTLNVLGNALIRQRQLAAAEPYLRESLERNRRNKGEEHPSTITDMGNLASLLMDTDKLAEAESLAREALEKTRRVLGSEQSQTLKSMNIMGQILFRQGKYSETEPLYQEALATGRRVLGEEHPDTIIWLANLGTLMQRTGRLAEAESYYADAYERNRRVMGPMHPYSLTMLRTLVDLLRQQKKLADAEVMLQSAVQEALRAVGEEHAETLSLTGLLASVYRDRGRLDDAEPLMQNLVEKNRRLQGDDHSNTVTAILRLGSLRVAQKKFAEALALLLPLEGKVQKAIPGNSGVLRNASWNGMVGQARAALAKSPDEFAVAESHALAAQSTFAKLRGDKDKETREWTKAVVDLYAAWDKLEPGKGYDAKSAHWQQQLEK